MIVIRIGERKLKERKRRERREERERGVNEGEREGKRIFSRRLVMALLP